ncbi:MAG TPA: SRPBCC family protein [Gemmatimonadaceae bacterium]
MTAPASDERTHERTPYLLGEMPVGSAMQTTDERIVHAPVALIFDVARKVELWPAYLSHYRRVRFRDRASDGGGLVEMSAWRPVGSLPGGWPTWWLSEMAVDSVRPAIRFRHVGGITREMEVEWSFHSRADGTLVRIVHAWNGPHWPLVGVFAATSVIGPHFIRAIAQRTLRGLGRVAEREGGKQEADSRNQQLLDASPSSPLKREPMSPPELDPRFHGNDGPPG